MTESKTMSGAPKAGVFGVDCVAVLLEVKSLVVPSGEKLPKFVGVFCIPGTTLIRVSCNSDGEGGRIVQALSRVAQTNQTPARDLSGNEREGNF